MEGPSIQQPTLYSWSHALSATGQSNRSVRVVDFRESMQAYVDIQSALTLQEPYGLGIGKACLFHRGIPK